MRARREGDVGYLVPHKAPADFVCESVKPPSVRNPVSELEAKLLKLKDRSYDGIDKLMRRICKEYKITPRKLHDDFKEKHKQIPDDWLKEQSK